MNKSENIICALDFNDLDQSISFIDSIEYDIIYKIGMEFFFNFGFEGINKIKKKKQNIKIFLDLKLHDIPNTVAKSLYPLLKNIQPHMFTLHISGGRKMLSEAVIINKEVSNYYKFKKPILLGVTILTSLSQEDYRSMGHKDSINDYVLRYANLASLSGLDGLVCSPLEIKSVKEHLGSKLKIVTPGIRFKSNSYNDQARIMSPYEAFQAGADYIVMGRPLINDSDPNKVIKDIIY